MGTSPKMGSSLTLNEHLIDAEQLKQRMLMSEDGGAGTLISLHLVIICYNWKYWPVGFSFRNGLRAEPEECGPCLASQYERWPDVENNGWWEISRKTFFII